MEETVTVRREQYRKHQQRREAESGNLKGCKLREVEDGAGHLEDWALCYGGGSSSAEICGDSSLSEDEELDDI
ncbi:hypothetical protein RIF29_26681 [Crotalaria pallida]|uniref:Uncharacterized protein n=1 Tax=Crotalaria pallida TaxID=3830 RepID=A0AAN9HY82_CROPI